DVRRHHHGDGLDDLRTAGARVTSVRSRIAPLADAVLPWLATAAMLSALACVFLYVPSERMQGPVQRIFYFHVNSAWSAFLGFVVAAGASALYLWRGRPEFDRL